MICSGCGQPNREGARFCDSCGARIEADAARTDRAERRQLTVVFCDLVGSTRLSREVDPEEFREIVSRYQEVATEAVAAFGGHTAIFLGDGILTYFGYPDAHEDDPERAIRASLAIVDGIRALDDAASGTDLAVRVAVHTGDVVVGDIDVAGAGIFGATPNVAARLQGVAPPNGVVVSEATLRLVQGVFRVEDLGRHQLAGLDAPIGAYRVLGPSGVRSRFARGVRSRRRIVGREPERDLMWRAWEDARDRAGQAVFVHGEAGVGKSRLVEAFHQRLGDAVHTWLECAGTPYMRDSAFAAVIELQSEALRLSADQTDAEKLAVIESAVRRSGMKVDEAVPILARLHSLDVPPESPYAGALEGLGADAIRALTKSVAGEWLLRLGRQQAVVLLVEDLHWLDPSSIELLGELLERVEETRALLLLTARPEFEAPWPPERVRSVALHGLDDRAARDLARTVPGADALSPETLDRIVERTDGVPLFIEEMARAAVEHDLTLGEDDAGVPATLKGLLMARIDALGPAREVAQLGSILGREFDERLLRDVSDRGSAGLDEALERIVAEDIAIRIGTEPDVRYLFRHALIQETAYESLLKTTRRGYHARVGEVLERRMSESSEARPELVAHHFTQALQWDRALPLWTTAGQSAANRSENVEADRHLRAGLACVDMLPEGPEKLQQELLLRTHLGANLISVRGYGAEEVEENISRAQTLCELIGPSPFLFPVLYNVWVFHLVRGDSATDRLSRDLVQLAEETDPERFLSWAHIARAISRYWAGDFEACRHHAEQCREHYRFDPESWSLFGDDTGAYGYLYQGLASWFMGEPGRFRRGLDEALEFAEEAGYAFTVAGTLAFRAQAGHFARDPDRIEANAASAIELSSAQGFPLFLATSLLHRGWMLCSRGELDEGLASAEQGIGIYRSTGALLNLHYHQSVLAEAHLMRGDLDRTLATLDIAFDELERGFDCYWEPELHRLRGEALLRQGHRDAGDASVAAALAAAGRMSSRMHELRAATTALEFASDAVERERRDLLVRLLSHFDAADDEPDLRKARAVLEG
jgi:class 3 adenylate cyclase/predicted ATPase